MHGLVREAVEEVLAARPFAAARRAAEHISRCGDCASEVSMMRTQAQVLKSLKTPAEVEPAPGFYARVLQRIEEHARRSIWWFFVYSPMGKRLTYASLALTLALGAYVIAAETTDGHLSGRDRAYDVRPAVPGHADVPVMGDEDEQRTAVLENFAARPVSYVNEK